MNGEEKRQHGGMEDKADKETHRVSISMRWYIGLRDLQLDKMKWYITSTLLPTHLSHPDLDLFGVAFRS